MRERKEEGGREKRLEGGGCEDGEIKNNRNNNGYQDAGEDVSSEAGVWLHDMQAGSRGVKWVWFWALPARGTPSKVATRETASLVRTGTVYTQNGESGRD